MRPHESNVYLSPFSDKEKRTTERYLEKRKTARIGAAPFADSFTPERRPASPVRAFRRREPLRAFTMIRPDQSR